jgi:Tfp pilus assembly protein FimV
MQKYFTILCTVCSITFMPAQSYADSRRIEVYPLTQTYIDVQPGDTLGEIAASLLPHNTGLQQKLMQDIMRLNPQSFPQNRAELMQANRRLWLPNSMQQPDSKVDSDEVQVRSFEWGNIKTRNSR